MVRRVADHPKRTLSKPLYWITTPDRMPNLPARFGKSKLPIFLSIQKETEKLPKPPNWGTSQETVYMHINRTVQVRNNRKKKRYFSLQQVKSAAAIEAFIWPETWITFETHYNSSNIL